MRRPVRLTLVFLVLAVLGAAAFIVWYERERPVGYYTDADGIRVPVAETEPRSVLWRPAEALPSPLNSARDEYEPRVSADGGRLYFVRGRPGDGGGRRPLTH